jgi:hypothetical protein
MIRLFVDYLSLEVNLMFVGCNIVVVETTGVRSVSEEAYYMRICCWWAKF